MASCCVAVLLLQVPRSIQPSKARPNRNEPALLPHVLKAVAAARGQTEAEVAAQTTATARKFFGLPGVLAGSA
jgi:TatD DNase family protein